jgi:peptidoglycan/LPS O-acetylase OafA/YrhL
MTLVGAVLFMREGWIRHLCRHPWLGYIAKISYALYIWHPMMTLGWLGTGDRWTLYLIKRPITFALTFLFAHVSTHTLEAYFIRLARSPGGFMREARRLR